MERLGAEAEVAAHPYPANLVGVEGVEEEAQHQILALAEEAVVVLQKSQASAVAEGVVVRRS